MTDRDRLIELLQTPIKITNGVTDCEIKVSLYEAGFIADHLLANGVIVPPCPIGTKIYMLVTRTTHRFEFPKGKMQRIESQHTFIKETYLTKSNFFKVLEDFCKTVFLTKEEAEAKLKEMENEKSN